MVGRLSRAGLLLIAICAGGCAGGGSDVLVELRTDHIPELEFDEVRVFLALASGSEQVLIHSVEPRDYTRGQRVVAFEGVPSGDHRIRAELLLGNLIVGSRTVLLSVIDNTSATLVVTRSCSGVMCPAADDPSATECAGGRCVSVACSPETPVACENGCATDEECVATASCAQGLCTAEGSCVFMPIEGACGLGEYCNPASGCVPSCVNGMCVDAGGPLPDYRWSAGEFGACSVTCGAGEERREVTCVDSAGGAVEDSLCAGTAPVASRTCEAGSPTCGLGEWSAFDSCDGDCSQTQTRACNTPGHCVGPLEQTRECSGGGCCPVAGATCGPTSYRRSGGWICRDDSPADFNVLFYSAYIFTEQRCDSSRRCVPQDLARNLECICSMAGPGCTSSTSGCAGAVSSARCRDVATGTRGPCPSTASHGDCF